MAMTRDQAVARILRRCKRYSTDTDLVSDIVAEWNLAEELTFERGYPKYWFLLDVAEITVDATGFKAALPARFIELFEDAPAVLMRAADGSALNPLEPTTRSNTEWSLSSPDTASAYSIMEGYLLLATALPVGTTLRILYYKTEPRNEVAYQGGSQPAANRWLQYAADLLIGKVGMVIAGLHDVDANARTLFGDEFAMAFKRLLAENTSRKEAALVRFLNGNVYAVADPIRTITQTA